MTKIVLDPSKLPKGKTDWKALRDKSDSETVKAARSDALDGWGIHWILGRGVIYNVWGFDCVRIQMGKKIVRVGTDDVEGLLSFLRTKVQSLQ